MWFFISIFCLFGLVILRVCYCLGFFGLIEKLCGHPVEEVRSPTSERNAMHPVLLRDVISHRWERFAL
ncbi:hypothetical protein OUZ56_018551 [Daphnia magna]|uniref:Secreted protein n=1 Tax=Daphnia magna TaxID=35525 RepID=A0ABQ9Z9C0_9CRUS|nr:hypothetical protein OUZ56_018551 [Daphnia magna]